MVNDDHTPFIEPFSEQYDIVCNAEIYTFSHPEAVMDFELFAVLEEIFGKHFLGKIGDMHYEFKPENAIPRGGVAVPEAQHDDPDVLLIQR